MLKQTIVASSILLAMTSFAQAKETLYIVNSGSKGGSYNAQLTAWASDLEATYDIEYVQAKGCDKASRIIDKITANGGQAISLYNSGWKHNSVCTRVMYPTLASHMWTDVESGIIFSREGETKSFIGGTVSVAFNGSNDEWLNAVAAANPGTTFELVRYENSKGVTLGVMNGETDFGMINSGSRYWKNTDKLDAHYVLNDSTEGIPSVSDFGGKQKNVILTYLYFGNDEAGLLADMQEIRKNPESNISKWYAPRKGFYTNIHSTNPEADHQLFLNEFPKLVD